jgi:phage baseplate assembly protein W
MSKALAFGFNPPFFGGQEKVLSRQEDERLIKNDILQLLLTVPGERVHRPNFGVNLRNFVFEALTDQDLLILEQEITAKLRTYEDRVTLENLELIPDENNYGLNVKLVTKLRSDPRIYITVERFFKDLNNG